MSNANNIQKRPLTIEDLKHIVTPSAASLCADGRYMVYVTTKAFLQENTYKDIITVVDVATKNELAVWEGSSPLWSPTENEIAYMAIHEKDEHIWIFSLHKKEHKPLVPVYESQYFMGHLSIKNFAWSPDGLMIAYVSADAAVAAFQQETNIKIIDRLLYKTKGGRSRPHMADNLLTHVWIVKVNDGAKELITDSVYNEHSISWSPDSSKIAFISNRSDDPDNNQLHDLWSIDLATKKITRHTNNIGTAYQPSWSPDGSCIAFLATTNLISTNDSPAEDTHAYLVAADGNVERCLTKTLDRRIEQISWHPEKATVYFTAGDKGTTAIYSVTVATGDIDTIMGEGCHILEYRFDKTGDHIVYTNTDTTHPAEVFVYNQTSDTTIQFTHLNDSFLQKVQLQNAETFWFKSFDDSDIQGWLIKPVMVEENQTYPLALVVHGGPHNMFGYEFEDRMQLLAAEAFGVLFLNPRGSSGYGQSFSYGCVQNWGGGDYKDLMAGVDVAIKQNNWIDADKLVVTGQSYGGYMTNWIITQTNRFKAAVSDGGISNLVSFAGTSLYHSLIESEFNGSAYENFALLWKCSPLQYVTNVTTPTLLLHGETDSEVPVSQAEEMYIALKKQGVKSRLVQYIGEGHGWRPDLLPRNRYDVLNRTIIWLKKYLEQ